MSSQQAFDSLAAAYDDSFTKTQIGRYLRQQVHTRLEGHFHAGDHVLELGCGTGEDALRLARRGVRVTATDVSEGMLRVAREKTRGNPLVSVERLDLRSLTLPLDPLSIPTGLPSVVHGEGKLFDGVFSNFGSLNCLNDWRPLAVWLADRVKPGGVAALGVMSPLCLWEIGWHGLNLNFKTATRRLRQDATFQPNSESQPMGVRYPTIGRMTRDFAPWFRRIHVQGLGLFLPPSDVFGVVEKRPRLLRLLRALERRFARFGALAILADHYWIEFRHVDE
jgi:SAM-dependent methyltransferase